MIKCVAPLLFAVLVLPHSGYGWTNDLKITSIRRTNDCTTLTWKSHAGEFYNVYWASNLLGHVFWRVAAIHVPSQGTNTTWSECEPVEEMMMMMGSGFGVPPLGGPGAEAPNKAPTFEEISERYEQARPTHAARAGAVSHVWEPAFTGINDTRIYFGLWAGGKSFAICA